MIRLLESSNPNDATQLQCVLESYKQDVLSHKNPIYLAENLHSHADWILSSFSKRPQTDFAICGEFDDERLVSVLVGYKLEVSWGREAMVEAIPHWVMGLLYFQNQQWRSPAAVFQQLADQLARNFEAQGYTKFYTVQKLPTRLLKTKDPTGYFSADGYFKTLAFTRYLFTLENVFMTQTEIEGYAFRSLKCILPRMILRPVMLISATRNPFK